jgi:hypothetical protein
MQSGMGCPLTVCFVHLHYGSAVNVTHIGDAVSRSRPTSYGRAWRMFEAPQAVSPFTAAVVVWKSGSKSSARSVVAEHLVLKEDNGRVQDAGF